MPKSTHVEVIPSAVGGYRLHWQRQSIKHLKHQHPLSNMDKWHDLYYTIPKRKEIKYVYILYHYYKLHHLYYIFTILYYSFNLSVIDLHEGISRQKFVLSKDGVPAISGADFSACVHEKIAVFN